MVPILWDYFMSRKESISLGFEDEKNLQADFLPKLCTSAGLEPETSYRETIVNDGMYSHLQIIQTISHRTK